jgi:hypothetical protein
MSATLRLEGNAMVSTGRVMRAAALGLALGTNVPVGAQDIASCSNPKGTAYYAEKGAVGPESSGWQDDYVTGGMTKVSMLGPGQYDLLYVDARQEIISSKAEGAHVILLHQSEKAFSLIVVYPGTTAEVYTFIENSQGRLEYLHTLSRAGGGPQRTTKASVMRGDCAYINFDALNEGSAATQ